MEQETKGFSLAWVIVIVLATTAIVGGAVYVLGKDQGKKEALEKLVGISRPKTSPSPTVSPKTSPTADQTAGWKTYTDKELSYGLKYPSTWYTRAACNGRGVEIYPSKEVGICEGSKVAPGKPVSNVFVAKGGPTLGQIVDGLKYNLSGYKEKEVQLAGSKATKIEGNEKPLDGEQYINSPAGTSRVVYLVEHNELVYEIHYYRRTGETDQISKFELLVSTFKFTK